MTRIGQVFRRLRLRGEAALIPYFTVGYPRLALLPELVQAAVDGGADLIELGIPFSDPLADGPTIQAASEKALAQGVSVRQVLAQVRLLRRRGVRVPLVLMTYYNPVLRYGLSRFCRESAASGADGLIVPDLPPEEAGDLKEQARARGLDLIFLAAPTSPPERLKKIARASTGFLYYVSLTGVTGARRSLPKEAAAQVRRIRRMTPLPVCVGFGVSRLDQVRELTRAADGVIVGSALLQVIGRAGPHPGPRVRRFLQRLKRGTHR